MFHVIDEHDGVTVDNMWRTPGRTLIRGVQSKLLCAPLTLSSLIQCKAPGLQIQSKLLKPRHNRSHTAVLANEMEFALI